MDDQTAIGRRAVLDAYEAACAREALKEKWLNGALFRWAIFDEPVDPPMFPIAPAASWSEHFSRWRVVDDVLQVVRARGMTLPEHIALGMLTWMHDVAGWNA